MAQADDGIIYATLVETELSDESFVYAVKIGDLTMDCVRQSDAEAFIAGFKKLVGEHTNSQFEQLEAYA